MMTKVNLLLWFEKSDNYAYLCYLHKNNRRELINDLVIPSIMNPELMTILNYITNNEHPPSLKLVKKKLLAMMNERELFVYNQLCRL